MRDKKDRSFYIYWTNNIDEINWICSMLSLLNLYRKQNISRSTKRTIRRSNFVGPTPLPVNVTEVEHKSKASF